MLMKLFFFIFLVVPLLPTDVSGQALSFNNTGTKKYCLFSSVLEGDKMTLYAVLDTTQYNTTNWTSVWITLQYSPPSSWKTICEMNITRGVCHAPEQGVCGYCDRLDGDIYYFAFNVMVSANGTSQTVYRIMAKSAFWSLNFNYLSFQVLGIPTVQTSVNYQIYYRTNNITSEAFVYNSNYTSVYTAFSIPSNISYRFNDQTSSSTAINTNTLYHNIPQWDRNVDTVLQVNMTDQCFRNWSFAIPVTNRPDVPECEPPVLYRSSLNGTQIVTRCRYSKLASVIEQQPFLSISASFSPYIPYTGKTVEERNITTFTHTVNSSTFSPSQTADIYIRFYPVMDMGYTNNTRKIPRVTRFNINGSRSIIVDEGADLTFECKVYGDPRAVAVLGGTDGGRIQEERSSTYLLLFTLAKVRCEDSGRYSCKGVNEFDSTPKDRQGFVDVSVKCPPFVKSHAPSDSNRKFIFEPGSNILVTLEVYGYPVPAEFGLKLEQRSTFSDLSQDQYSVSSAVLNPSFALITLRIFTRNNTGSQSFIFTMSNGANSSSDFQFQVERSGTETPHPGEPSTSPWMPAFIAVICVAGVAVIVAVVVYAIKKRYHNKGMTSKELSNLNVRTSSTPPDGRQAKVVAASQSGQRTSPTDKHTYRNVDPSKDPNTTRQYGTTAGADDEQIYENVQVQDNLYEFPS